MNTRFPSVVRILAAILLASPVAWAQNRPTTEFDRPTKHFSLEDAAELDHAKAEQLYRELAEMLAEGYALSGLSLASGYQTWRRFNIAPYRSAQHGNRYINSYANPVAAERYGQLASGEAMPVGSVLAKDSFAATKDGGHYPGPLFLMRKMAPGFDPAAGDWQYAMVMPDGSLFGVSGGDNEQAVKFCGACHELTAESQDHLFFVPRKHREKDD